MTHHSTSHPTLTEARACYDAGSFSRAAELYQAAAAFYASQGSPLDQAEMMNNCSVARLKAGDPAGALEAALGTDQVFAAANDSRRQAMALGNQAAAYEALGDFPQAMQRYEQSADMLTGPGDRELRAYVLSSLSALQLKTGSQFQSLATMQAALEAKPKLTVKERLLKKLFKVPFQMLR